LLCAGFVEVGLVCFVEVGLVGFSDLIDHI